MSGKFNRAKGKIEQAAGGLAGNHELERKGRRDELKGQVEGAAGDVKHAAAGVVKDAKAALNNLSK
jgi:uncharacterized protein YjbJ (UPF0337 family)